VEGAGLTLAGHFLAARNGVQLATLSLV